MNFITYRTFLCGLSIAENAINRTLKYTLFSLIIMKGSLVDWTVNAQFGSTMQLLVMNFTQFSALKHSEYGHAWADYHPRLTN